MKRFISTKLFRILQEASEKGIDTGANVLKNEYVKFAMLLFSESAAFTDKAACHNVLVYTRVELASLTKVSGKKCGNLS